MIKRSLSLMIVISMVLTLSYCQNQQSKLNSLILVTAQTHEPIKSITDVNQIIKNNQNIQAVKITTDDSNSLIDNLKNVAKNFQISRQQVSSLLINKQDLEKVQKLVFQDTQSIEDIKTSIISTGKNILLYINQIAKQPRKLSQTHEQQLLINVNDQKQQRSEMFANMDSITLTGLLVSLFLIIVLLIAIKCLFEVKTNDQFGRTNLWVGKQS